jgi:hypothetical protein
LRHRVVTRPVPIMTPRRSAEPRTKKRGHRHYRLSILQPFSVLSNTM